MLRVYCTWPALRRRKEPVGDIDGDALLALGLQAIHQQRKIELFAGRTVAGGIALKRCQLILEDQLGVVEKAADQSRLAIINRAAGQETQQRLVRLPRQVGADFLVLQDFGDFCFGGQGNARAHQK
jgi:hypothetical protein